MLWFAGHELKTPVTVMKASLDMLEREGVHSKYLDYAAEENEKMRKLVIELLDYSKMEYQEETGLHLWEQNIYRVSFIPESVGENDSWP